jgi:hypothetical protein
VSARNDAQGTLVFVATHEATAVPSYPAWFFPTHAGLTVGMRADEPPEKWFVTPTRVSGPTTIE